MTGLQRPPTPAGMQAETDQQLAMIAANRRRPPDDAVLLTLPIASDLASNLAAEFGGDAAVAGRAIVSVAGKILGLMHALDAGDVAPAQTARVMVNTLAFAGEQMYREAQS